MRKILIQIVVIFLVFFSVILAIGAAAEIMFYPNPFSIKVFTVVILSIASMFTAVNIDGSRASKRWRDNLSLKIYISILPIIVFTIPPCVLNILLN